jgi:hypothetical protein
MKYKHAGLTCDVEAEMGTIRIDAPDVALYFTNGYGDGQFTCTIQDAVKDNIGQVGDEWGWSGFFDVKTTATLSAYDCENEPVAELMSGTWDVYYREYRDIWGERGNTLLVRREPRNA